MRTKRSTHTQKPKNDGSNPDVNTTRPDDHSNPNVRKVSWLAFYPTAENYSKCGTMAAIELSKETVRKLRAFGKVMDVILGSKNVAKTESERAELVVSIGLERMLQDVLPKEEMLMKTMAQMFDRNPEFVCEFVSDMVRKNGEEKQKGQADEAQKRWSVYA